MDIRTAYNSWSEVYDADDNKTRDLEGAALRMMLQDLSMGKCLEIGCGTGKNTIWLSEKFETIVAVDISEGMLEKAKAKISDAKVNFITADITKPWNFVAANFDIVTFSLVLEHISDLDFIFQQASRVLRTDGFVYLGELHPFKQYLGTKARFEKNAEMQFVECYNHHISEFVQAAESNGFKIFRLQEFFDKNDNLLPRILTIIFQKI